MSSEESQHTNDLEESSGSGEHEGHITDETVHGHPNRVRKKIRVRKRIRIRKKPSAKKKLKKYGERLFWFLIIGGFIAALIVMIVELDIRDEKFKKTKKKSAPVRQGY